MTSDSSASLQRRDAGKAGSYGYIPTILEEAQERGTRPFTLGALDGTQNCPKEAERLEKHSGDGLHEAATSGVVTKLHEDPGPREAGVVAGRTTTLQEGVHQGASGRVHTSERRTVQAGAEASCVSERNDVEDHCDTRVCRSSAHRRTSSSSCNIKEATDRVRPHCVSQRGDGAEDSIHTKESDYRQDHEHQRHQHQVSGSSSTIRAGLQAHQESSHLVQMAAGQVGHLLDQKGSSSSGVREQGQGKLGTTADRSPAGDTSNLPDGTKPKAGETTYSSSTCAQEIRSPFKTLQQPEPFDTLAAAAAAVPLQCTTADQRERDNPLEGVYRRSTTTTRTTDGYAGELRVPGSTGQGASGRSGITTSSSATASTTTNPVDLPPPLPSYAGFDSIMRGFKDKSSTMTSAPLKPMTPARVNKELLKEWGAQHLGLIGLDLFNYIDKDLLAKAVQDAPSTSALPQYVEDLVNKYKWLEFVPRHEQGSILLWNNAFPVAKTGGTEARWVVHCRVNDLCPDLPVDVMLDRLEDVIDSFGWFEGGVEYDGVSWYGQFLVEEEVSKLFGIYKGSIKTKQVVMPQGFKGATKVGQDALCTITKKAYMDARTTKLAVFNYIDNSARLCDKEDNQHLEDLFSRTIREVGADFGTLGAWSNSVTFIGTTMCYDITTATRTVGTKEKWASKAHEFLLSAAIAREVPRDSILGVILWILRVARLPLGVALPAIQWESNVITPSIRELIRGSAAIAIRPRILLEVITHVQYGVIDASQRRVASLLWKEVSFRTPTNYNKPFQHEMDDAALRAGREAKVEACDLPAPTRINLAELLGVYHAVIQATSNTLLLLLTDSITARSWAWKGIAGSDTACRIVLSIQSLCSIKNIRLAIGWIRGGDLNPADPYTRDNRTTGHTVNLEYPMSLKTYKLTRWI